MLQPEHCCLEPGPHTWRARRDPQTRQTAPNWYTVVSRSKGTYFQGLCWAAARGVELCAYLPNLGSLYRGLNGGQSHIPSGWSQHTLPSHSCILENGSCCGNSKQNINSKDRGECEESLISPEVSLTCQSEVMTAQ